MSILWPYKVDWASGLSWEIAFQTSIYKSLNHTETRRADRIEPRQTYSYAALQGPAGTQAALANILSRIGEEMVFPLPLEVGVSDTVTALATEVDFLTVPSWLQAGTSFFLNGEQHFIASVDGNKAYLNSVVQQEVKPGTLAYSAFVFRLAKDFGVTHPTSRVSQNSCELAGLIGENAVPSTGVAFPTFAGREVFTRRANWREKVDRVHIPGVELVDFGYGRRGFDPFLDHVPTTTKVLFSMFKPEDVAEVVAIFMRMKGRRGTFYRPSDIQEVELQTGLVSGVSEVLVAGTEAQLFELSTAHKHIFVELNTGEYLFNTVTGYREQSGNTVFELETAWGNTVDLEDIRRFGWLYLSRFGSDVMDVSWETDKVAEVTAAFYTLPSEEAPDVI